MQKYTAKDIREQKISFRYLTEEQFNKLKDHFQKLYPDEYSTSYKYSALDKFHRFYYSKDSDEKYIWGMKNSYLDTYIIETSQATKEITFDEFDFEELTELPKYWIVKCTKENKDIFNDVVIKYIDNNYTKEGEEGIGTLNTIDWYIGHDGSAQVTYMNGINWFKDITKFKNNPVELTLEQFIKLTKMEDKKIIGYKLKKEFENYRQVAKTICGVNDFLNSSVDFDINSLSYDNIKKAGVLDIWFEPVYEPEKPKEENVSMNGQFSLRVTKDGIFHGNENITEYVANVVDFANSIPTKFDKYDFHYSEMKLSKTGCESKETKLSDWINVWKKYKRYNYERSNSYILS